MSDDNKSYKLLTGRQQIEIVQARLVQAEATLYNTRLNIEENEVTGNEAAQPDLKEQERQITKQVAFYRERLAALQDGGDGNS